MINSKLLRALYGGTSTVIDFCYDNITAPPLLSLMHPYDIEQLNQIATSIELAGNVDKKYQIIDSIMKFRNFKRLAAGTNRLVYTHLEYPFIVVKVAVDEVGMKDNPAEFKNQRYIKPFCCKVFEVSPCGTVAIFERVERITSRYEFATIADDIFDMITNKLVGKYVLEDIGTNFMYNWGIRKGFGPVLLDFPYVYELDGAKIFCNSILDNGYICGGEIDYDPGFNFLTCKKCGKPYSARDLSKPSKESGLFIQAKKKGVMKMKVECIRNGKVIRQKEYKDQNQFMKKPKKVLYPEKEITSAKDLEKDPIVIGVRGRKKKSELKEEFAKAEEKKRDAANRNKGKYGEYVRVRVPKDYVETPSGFVDPFANMVKANENTKANEDKVEDTVTPTEIDNDSVSEDPIYTQDSQSEPDKEDLENNRDVDNLVKDIMDMMPVSGFMHESAVNDTESKINPDHMVKAISFEDDESDTNESENEINDSPSEDNEESKDSSSVSIEAVLPTEKPSRPSIPRSVRYSVEFYNTRRK